MNISEICMKWSGGIALVGRVLVGVFFLMAGISKFMDIEGTAAFMASAGIPFSGILVWVASVFLVVTGVWVMTGKKLCWAAGLLAAYTVLVTLIFHVGEGQMQAFMKNAAILGGLLGFMASCQGTCQVREEK